MSESVKKSIKVYALISCAFCLVQIIISCIFFNKGNLLSLILGAVYGNLYNSLMFFHMGKLVTKASSMEEKEAKIYMQTRYTFRMIILALAVVLAVYISFVNVYAVIIPMIYSRLVLFITGLIYNKKGGEKNECNS
mgnify:CR=1 FL=1